MPSREFTPASEGKVIVGNPNVPGYHSSVNAAKYRAMKDILLKVFPTEGLGITQSEMISNVAAGVVKDVFPGKTYMWWAKCVQLDMGSKKELIRVVSAKPLRWLKVA